MVELLQSILTLTKEFGLGIVSSVGCLVLVWYMWIHIKEISKQHNERFDKLHEMHKQEREEEARLHRLEREEKEKQHKEERTMIVSAFDNTTSAFNNVAKAVNGLEITNAKLTTFIEAKL